ncbi:hypothetical protein BD410DRAFT_899825 [Rickenella mellea]|uniref:Uncharacterized protein n=1 Tax=Rickenella mellea TaxID=50990 RepID=A0A4Y7PYS1_9AGAM|nr:hypothetical protein BD410DRAFT_899825 [Rickenella mellea]
MVNTTGDPVDIEKIKLELTKIEDGEGKNNYMEFADKTKFKLDAVGLWDYIEGDRAKEPKIPDLVEGKQIKGKDATGKEVTITTDGNDAEVTKAKKDAEPWWRGTKKVLTLIVDAVPSKKMYLVRGCKTAKEAWDALRQHYKPSNQHWHSGKATQNYI